MQEIKTIDGRLSVNLFDYGMVEIESPIYKNVGIEVNTIDPTEDVDAPKDAIYKIDIYAPEYMGLKGVKAKPSEYDIVWVMKDGTILHRKDRRLKGL